eukprot:4425448-Pyramimonas_sp.AAC.1
MSQVSAAAAVKDLPRAERRLGQVANPDARGRETRRLGQRDPALDEVGETPREPRPREQPLLDGPGGLEGQRRRSVADEHSRGESQLELEGEH